MKSKRSRTYLVSGLTLALIFVAIILVFRDVLPDIVKDLSTVPFWGVLLLLALGFAYEAMESVLCLVIIHHKKPDCTFIDALRVTFLGVFGNITTLGAGTLPMQSFYLYRRGLDAGSGLGIMASEYVLHKISVLIVSVVGILVVVGLLITAGNEGQNHDESEKQRKKLLHSSILPYFSGRRRAALRFILKCGCTSSDSIAKAKGRIKSDSPQFYFFCDN